MIASDVYMLVFRIVHIGVGVLWVGSVFLFVVFVQPSAAAIAPAGAPFMGELLGTRKLVDRLVALGVTTVVGGPFVYWRDWHQYESFGSWIGSAFGVTLTSGRSQRSWRSGSGCSSRVRTCFGSSCWAVRWRPREVRRPRRSPRRWARSKHA